MGKPAKIFGGKLVVMGGSTLMNKAIAAKIKQQLTTTRPDAPVKKGRKK